MARRRLPDPHAVLAGDARVDLAELVTLIHQVNPTGRSLRPQDENERYALKSRLQSLLIRRFPEWLEVEADPLDPEVVSLRLRSGGRDAGHARLDGLEDDARSWVRFQLDATDAPPDLARAPADARPTRDDPLSRGRRALEDYDYDQARRCFEEALDRPAAAIALLELLVDVLALDEDALALEARLPEAARRSGEVQGLLALATARSGSKEAAHRLVEGASGSRAADAVAELARRAAREGNLERAHAWRAQLAELDPLHPRLAEVDAAVLQARAEARGPEEEALQALVASGDLAMAEARAEALLARWPQSTLARDVLRQLAERRTRLEREAAKAEAEAAAGRGDRAGELVALERAAAAGDTDVAARVAVLRQAIRQDEERRQVERVEHRLYADRRAGLRAWCALPPALRGRVRGEPLLEPLGRLLAEGRRGDPVDAVLALEAAATIADPKAALERLAPHEALLLALPEGRRRLRALEEAERARRRQETIGRLTEAERLVEEGDHEAAEQLLRHALPPDPDLRERANRATTALAAARRRVEAERAWGEHLEREAWIEARDLAWSNVRHDPRWRERVLHAEARIEESFRPAVLPPEAGWPDARDLDDAAVGGRVWVDDMGREAMLVDARGRWLTCRTWDLGQRRVTQVAVLRTPLPLADVHVHLHQDVLTVLDGHHLLQVDVRTWRMVAWRRLHAILPDGFTPAGMLVSPDGGWLWLWSEEGDASCAHVVDLQGWRLVRTFPGAARHAGLYGDPDGRVVRMPHGGGLEAWRGITPELSWDLPETQTALPRHGDGGVLVVCAENRGEPCSSPGSVIVQSRKKGMHFRAILSGTDRTRPVDVATGARTGLHYLLIYRLDGMLELRAMTYEHPRLATTWEGPVGEDSGARLLVSSCGEAVLLTHRSTGAPHLVPLRMDPPELPEEGSVTDTIIPDFRPSIAGRSSWLRNRAAAALHALQQAEEPASPETVDSLRQRRARDPEALALLAWAAHELDLADLAREVAADASALGRLTPLARSVLAHLDTLDGRLASAEEHLAALEADPSDPDFTGNLASLRGVLAFASGDLEEAMRAFRSLEAWGDPTLPRIYAAWIETLLRREPAVEIGNLPLLRAILAADAAKEPREVIEHLDAPVAWEATDLQTAARRARAWLAIEPGNPDEWYRKLAALATLVHRLRRGAGLDLPLAGHALSVETIRETAEEARRWLEETRCPGEG